MGNKITIFYVSVTCSFTENQIIMLSVRQKNSFEKSNFKIL